MSIRDLYHEDLLARARRARAAPDLPGATAAGRADNPLCGDRIRLELIREGDEVRAISVGVRGCALCQASATVIEERAPGTSVADLTSVSDELAALLAEEADTVGIWPELNMFSPVAPRRSRRKCVTLPFDALADALAQSDG